MKLPFVPREREAWSLLLLFALAIRLAALGLRAMSHDESLHALYSWYFTRANGYDHNPMMHGPLLFHMNAVVFLLLGATDFTARLIPALAGTACVATALLFRPHLGRGPAFLLGLLLCVEPGLLHYSRYIRNDIYICLFTLLMFHVLLRYPRVGGTRLLYLLSAALALSFASKEVCFIHGFVFGTFCVLQFLLKIHRRERERWGDLAVLILAMALPFATPLLHLAMGWDPLDNLTTTGQKRTLAGFLLFLGAALALLVGWSRFRHPRQSLEALGIRFLGPFGLFWLIQLHLYTSMFTNVRPGFCSGVAGSLGYWLAQHEVQRGSPDHFFYVSLLVLYSPLLLYHTVRSLRLGLLPRHVLYPLLWWTLGNTLVYSLAGERMPWLVVHITLPLCLLAAPSLWQLLRDTSARQWACGLAWCSPVLLCLLWLSPAPGPIRLLAALCITVAALYTLHRPRRRGPVLTLLLLLQFILNTVQVNGPRAEHPTEPLVYAHGGYNLKSAISIIHRTRREQPDSRVYVQEDYTWPNAWYLRHHPCDYGKPGDPIPDGVSVAMVDRFTADTLSPEEWTRRGTFHNVAWPLQDWHTLSASNFKGLFTHRRTARRFLAYYFLRHHEDTTLETWPLRNEFVLLTREPAP